MKTCEQCGNPVPEEKAFCPNCGAAMIEERERTTELVEGMGETLFEPVPAKVPLPVKPPSEKPAEPPAKASAKSVKAAPERATASTPERPRQTTAKRAVTSKAAAKSAPAEQNGKLYLILYASAALFLLSLLIFVFLYVKGKI
ncbi:MAG TPA: zinc-ribbon domain-containing protein [Pyrinomonadaceae bacterium]|jgi:hypothetical protein